MLPLPVRARTPLGPTLFNQVVDSFVHPDYRRGLKRPGLFVHTALPALDLWSQQGDGLFHGVPVDAARRMSIAFLGYKEWRTLDYLCRDATASEVAAPTSITVRRVRTLSADVDALATALADEKTCLALRDRAYLDWRYVRNPTQCYEIFEARRDGRLVGISVLRPVHELLAGACTFAELLTGIDQEEVIDALVATATVRARELGRRMLLALFPPHARETAALVARGFQVVPSPTAEEFYRSIGIRLAQPKLTSEMLAASWWYSFGDFDLV